MTTKSAASTPLEWLHSLGNSLNEFFDLKCKSFNVKKRDDSGCKVPTSAIKKVVPSTVKKQTISEKRRSSFGISTPLKGKSPTTNSILINEPATPVTSVAATPFTEGRIRRNAATKADKYIDIVSRRLAEVPANGSTPKSMKIASKLISEATPNSRRNILLSSTTKASTAQNRIDVQSTPKNSVNNIPSVIPAATPTSVRKRNRTAKIRQLFETPLLSLASAVNSLDKSSGEFSPSSIGVAPSTISKSSKLCQVHTVEITPLKKTSKIMNSPAKVITSPIKEKSVKQSPVKKTIFPINRSPAKKVYNSVKQTPVKKVSSPIKQIKPTPAKKSSSPITSVKKVSSPIKQIKQTPAKKVSSPVKSKSPARRSPRVSPFKAADIPVISTGTVAATPKAPVVEYVAPQSVLRSSKRPRKQGSLFNDDTSKTSSPALAKHARITNDPTIFPTVNFNSQSHVKMTPQTPIAPVAAMVPPPVSSIVRTSNINVPAIIVPPLSSAKPEESNSTEDLSIMSAKRTPLRVQPSLKTPSRAKAVIPSLSDYSAAAKIAVIEVSKNIHYSTTNPTNNTPKVEPWTNRFMMQKDKDKEIALVPTNSATAFNIKSSLNISVKPVDTSKISGFSSASVPIVPKFPLNLANISNITKSNTSLPITVPTVNAPIVPTVAASPAIVSALNAPPPESPLTRAKRIDSENSSREEKIKSLMEQKAEKLKKAAENDKYSVPSSSSNNLKQNNHNNHNNTIETSKLPIKPKSSTTILPSPKIPSRLAEAFSGIDSELPPIDIGLVDDEKVLKSVLNGNSAVREKELSNLKTISTAPSGFVNPKMKKNPPPAPLSSNLTASTTNTNSSSSTNNNNNNGNQQLHRTAVLNSAARKATTNPNTNINATTSSNTNNNLNVPTTPKPAPPLQTTKTDSSSPFLPEIPSDDELERRENMKTKHEKENRPTWATTPNLAVALNAQRSQRAEDVFGKVQPIKLEDFFKGSGKKFPNRSSTSNWNNHI